MKKFKKGVLAIGVLAAAAVIAAGCGKKDAKTTNETKKESVAESAVTEKKKLTYAKGTGPYTELFEQHVMPILEKQGYTFEATELTLQYADEAIAENLSVILQNRVELGSGYPGRRLPGHSDHLGRLPGVFHAGNRESPRV